MTSVVVVENQVKGKQLCYVFCGIEKCVNEARRRNLIKSDQCMFRGYHKEPMQFMKSCDYRTTSEGLLYAERTIAVKLCYIKVIYTVVLGLI